MDVNALTSSSPDDQNLDKLAIDAALACNWEEAIRLNNEIIKDEPQNIACLNRLARALMEMGKYNQAKQTYEQVLGIDPYNVIAQKNLKRVQSIKKLDGQALGNSHSLVVDPNLFLEEPGITQTVNLIKVAEPQRLLTLSAGSVVKLQPKNRGISVMDMNNQYIGALPDDISHLIIKLSDGGNQYQALIKSIKNNGVTLLIREVFRAKKFKNQPSFISNTSAATYSSKNIFMLSDDMGSSDSSSEEMDDTMA